MKNITLKRIAASAISIAVLGSFTACSGSASETTAAGSAAGTTAAGTTAAGESAEDTTAADDQTAEGTVITIGASVTPHTEILEFAKPILEEQGITLEIVTLEDYITPNTGVIEGSLDANYCEHQPYLDQFNEENGSDLVSIGAVHYEPFGIYAGRVDSLEDLPDGALIAVPNDVTNEARALLLLEQEGFITLSDDAGINATVADIVENPHDIQLVELAPEQLVATLPDVDFAVINGNYAIEGGLSVNDALAVEANDGLAAQTYGNIIVTSPDHADDPALAALVDVLQGPEVAEYIESTYDGAVVPLF